MKKIFTILVFTLSLSGLAQKQHAYLRLDVPELTGQTNDGLVNEAAGRELYQLYDTITNWTSTDGVLHYASQTLDFVYDNLKKVNSTELYWYNNHWVLNYNSGWSYDGNGRLKLAVTFYGADTNSRVVYDYDVNGNLIFKAEYNNLGEDTLTLVSRTDQQFNTSNKLVQKIIYKITGEDTTRTRTSYEYYPDNRTKVVTEETGNGIAWVNNWRNDYTYNADTATIVTSPWQNGNWAISKRVIQVINPDGELTYYLLQNYSGGNFINNGLHLWTYDENGGLVNYLIKDWIENAWVDVYRQNCINDDRGNLIYSQEEYLEDNQWILFWIMRETHDQNNFLVSHSDHIVDYQPEFIDSTHYYFQTVLGKPEHPLASVKTYPNPVNTQFTIDLPLMAEQIELYTISGNLVRTLPVNERIYNIADLPKGIYLLRVKTPKGFMNQKIVKL
ncbi:MAG TPA: T9SS type A sorting domain-containing protein [Lentimicrobium sp.]|nr:T9SS type A sorting domain-containing protein [Lentimicrobium sp.]